MSHKKPLGLGATNQYVPFFEFMTTKKQSHKKNYCVPAPLIRHRLCTLIAYLPCIIMSKLTLIAFRKQANALSNSSVNTNNCPY